MKLETQLTSAMLDAAILSNLKETEKMGLSTIDYRSEAFGIGKSE